MRRSTKRTLNNEEIGFIFKDIENKHHVKIMNYKEFEQIYGSSILKQIQDCNAFTFINNLVYRDGYEDNNRLLYLILHELGHYLMHCKKNLYDMMYRCKVELEAEYFARSVMDNLNLEYNSSRIEINNKRIDEFKDIVDDDNTVDYIDYFNYESNNAAFSFKGEVDHNEVDMLSIVVSNSISKTIELING